MKTILEVCYLDDELITRASNLCVEAGASYIKTGTGWGPSPTTVEHIKLIRKTIGSAAKIKAAGYSPVAAVLLTNSDDYPEFKVVKTGKTQRLEEVFTV